MGPPTCQQMDPALTPPSTVPDSHARTRARSTPCNLHNASRFATEPPPTQMTSAASIASSTSRLGWGNSAKWSTSQLVSASAEYIAARYWGSSPEAVSTNRTRGRGRPDSSSARVKMLPGRITPHNPVPTKPPLLATIQRSTSGLLIGVCYSSESATPSSTPTQRRTPWSAGECEGPRPSTTPRRRRGSVGRERTR